MFTVRGHPHDDDRRTVGKGLSSWKYFFRNGQKHGSRRSTAKICGRQLIRIERATLDPSGRMDGSLLKQGRRNEQCKHQNHQPSNIPVQIHTRGTYQTTNSQSIIHHGPSHPIPSSTNSTKYNRRNNQSCSIEQHLHSYALMPVVSPAVLMLPVASLEQSVI